MAKKDNSSRPINEPQPDWAPLWQAPFLCTRDGRMHTRRTWPDAFAKDARRAVTDLRHSRASELFGLKWPEWDFEASKEYPSVTITASGVVMVISPNELVVYAKDHPERFVIGSSEEMFEDPEWNETLSIEGAVWLKFLLRNLFRSWARNFSVALRQGNARVMARKNGVLAPFERIMWGQWLFFKLNDKEEIKLGSLKWYDVRHHPWVYEHGDRSLESATSPAGERIFSIYVAPHHMENEDQNHKCTRRVIELMTLFPDRCPMSRQELAKQMREEHPKLLKKQIDGCLNKAIIQSGKTRWLRSGRPANTLPESV